MQPEMSGIGDVPSWVKPPQRQRRHSIDLVPSASIVGHGAPELSTCAAPAVPWDAGVQAARPCQRCTAAERIQSYGAGPDL